MEKISIVIPTFNRSAVLKKLLTALRAELSSAPQEIEIIVADDRSTDDTAAMIKSEFPFVLLVNGLGKDPDAARRIGIEASTGNFIVCLDDDCIPRSGWLDAARSAIGRGEKLIQLKIVFHDLGQIECHDESPINFRTGFRFDMMPVTILHGGYRGQYIHNCHEFGLFVSRDILEKEPFDDPNLVTDKFGASASFYLRVSALGYKVWFEPEGVIDHFGLETGGNKDRVKKVSPKKNCTAYVIGMVCNFMLLTRMSNPAKLIYLVPYYILGGIALSIKQRKNCLKFFVKGLIWGLTRKLVPVVPYQNLKLAKGQ